MEGTPYNISDAARMLAVEDHALRYWESQLGIEIPRNQNGHRFYEERQITLFGQVKRLKEKGFTLKQIRAILPKIEQVSVLEEERLIALRRQLEGLIGKEEQAEQLGQEEQTEQLRQTEQAEQLRQAEQIEQTARRGQTKQEEQTEQLRQEGQPGAICAVPQEKVCTVEGPPKSKLEEFKKLMGELILEALKKNNEALSETVHGMVSERLVKEIGYLFKEQEEQEEERYRKLDRTIREYQHARQRIAAAAEKKA